MNRRDFFSFACGGVVAAAVAPFAKPAAPAFPYIPVYGSSLSCGVPSVGIVDFGQSLYLGEADFSNVKYAIAEIEALMSVHEREACDAVVWCTVEAAHQEELDEVTA